MRIGICVDLMKASLVSSAGFDYIEGALTSAALASDEDFGCMLSAVEHSRILAESFNVMLPGSFRLTGPEADFGPVKEYLQIAFSRASQLGAKIQVFGSGAARNVPEGWPIAQALDQLAEFLLMAAPIAGMYGISIAIEPLNPKECNIINTVADALALARRVSLPNVGALADWYHMAVQNEETGGMLAAGQALLHCHIANPAGRRFPLLGDGADFSPFFGALKRIGYSGRVSVEGSGGEEEYAAACSCLKACL